MYALVSSLKMIFRILINEAKYDANQTCLGEGEKEKKIPYLYQYDENYK